MKGPNKITKFYLLLILEANILILTIFISIIFTINSNRIANIQLLFITNGTHSHKKTKYQFNSDNHQLNYIHFQV